MGSRWNEKQAKKAEFAMNKMLDTGSDSIDFEGTISKDTRAAAMGAGDEELFEKKLTKEEKKALAKAKREAKKQVCFSTRLCYINYSMSFYSTRTSTVIRISSFYNIY